MLQGLKSRGVRANRFYLHVPLIPGASMPERRAQTALSAIDRTRIVLCFRCCSLLTEAVIFSQHADILIACRLCSMTNLPLSSTDPFLHDADPCAEFGGIYNYHPKGDTCCSESCGVCENADCRKQPGARANCCPGFLRAADNICSETNPAPCKLATNLVL